MLPSSADFAVCYLAAMRLGAIVLWAAASREAWTAAAAEESTGRNRLLGQAGLVRQRRRILLVDTPLSPFPTGRQASRDDRTGWKD
jgi:acyl-coenzyme A synthetase/AMP-(fatty) acid ligase